MSVKEGLCCRGSGEQMTDIGSHDWSSYLGIDVSSKKGDMERCLHDKHPQPTTSNLEREIPILKGHRITPTTLLQPSTPFFVVSKGSNQ